MPLNADTLGAEDVIGHPALTDAETGLANHLHFELVYRYMFLAGDRGVAFAVMLVSIDEGEGPNPAPDRRQKVARALQGTTRMSDLVAHAGADRFVVLLLATNLPGARIAADRIESALTDAASAPVSIGLATFHPEMKAARELLSAAESALERARKAGGGVEMA